MSGARRSVQWIAARSGTKRWNAKAREGRNRRAYPLAPKPDARQDPHPRRGSPPGMVGRE
ncbi:hypothetical protein [Halomontanus rarus]|uniref:hypothetical protein n=1 Tax=Halomontanus rarus TaxID=3034020 RepID=UPI00307C83DC